MRTYLAKLVVLLSMGALAVGCGAASSSEEESGGASAAQEASNPSVRFDPGFETRRGGEFSLHNAVWLARAAEIVYEQRATQVAMKSKLEQAVKQTGSDVKIRDYQFFETTDDSQAAYVETDHAAILAFRGTESTDDIDTDLQFGKVSSKDKLIDGHVHAGFYKAYESLWEGKGLKGGTKEGVGAYLERTKARRNVPLYITGHSLGAAIATLALRRANIDKIPVTALYTFGSPRVGTPLLANEIAFNAKQANTAIFRVVNKGDGVTEMPKIRYKHVSLINEDEEKNPRLVFLSETYGRYYVGTPSAENGFGDRFWGYLSDIGKHHPMRFYVCKLDRLIDKNAPCRE